MSLASQASVVERDIFGALIGTVCGVLVCRFALLVIDVNVIMLVSLLAIGAWSGGFVTHLRSSQSELVIKSLQVWAAPFRRVCLRIMLWLLGAAAALGVLSVLTANYDLVGRLAGTAAITAFAAGLLWPFSIMLDRDANRGAGLFGMICVIVVYLLVTPVVWQVGHRGEEAALAGLVIALMMPVGLVLLRLVHIPAARVASLVGLVIYAVVLALYLIALWNWRHGDDWFEVGTALGGFGVLALACLVGVATGDRSYWRWAGVLSAVTACAMYIWGTWHRGAVSEELMVVVAGAAGTVAHANIAMLVPLKGGQKWLRIGTICAHVTVDLRFVPLYREP